MKKEGVYTAGLQKDAVRFTPEMKDFLRRRTLPFMNDVGLDRPISFVLEEVYLQGMRDAVEVLTPEKTPPLDQ